MVQCFYVHIPFALKKQHSFNIKIATHSVVFDFGFIIISEIIKPDAILFFVNQINQLFFDFSTFCRVHYALKNGILHSFAIINALLSNFAQPFSALRSFCTDIVCNQNKHFLIPTSTRTADSRQYRHADIVPTKEPEHTAPFPIELFLQDMGALSR